MLSSYFDIIHGPQGIDSTSSKQAPAVTEVASVVWISGLWTEYDAASAIDPGASVCLSFATWKHFVDRSVVACYLMSPNDTTYISSGWNKSKFRL